MELILPVLLAAAAIAQRRHATSHSRRGFLLAGAVLAAALALPSDPAGAQNGCDWTAANWVGTWGTAPAGPPASLMTFSDQTLRLIVHTSIGGAQVRIRVSNEMGATPLRIGAAHIALRQGGADIVAGSDRVLTFSGFASITIPAGAPVLSDPVELTVPALADLAVSLYLPGEVQASTIHGSAFQTNFVSLPGDFTRAASLPIQRTITSWPFLTEVEVNSAPLGRAVVALGDSITDGSRTTIDANSRWPDVLARRLQTTRESLTPFTPLLGLQFPALLGRNARLGVVNRGIDGNRLLRDPLAPSLGGRSALERFDRDVLASAGVEYVIVLIGINDIGAPGTAGTPAGQGVTVEELIVGYRQLIARAHASGLAIFGGTLAPFEGTAYPGYYTPEKDLLRQAVNTWIRSSDEFDGVIDFERALRDPSHPTRMLPAFDSGDHLHPNELGMQAMANAIPLDLFRSQGYAELRQLLRK